MAAWGPYVKHPRFLALCIRRTLDLRGCIKCKNMRLIQAKLPYTTAPCPSMLTVLQGLSANCSLSLYKSNNYQMIIEILKRKVIYQHINISKLGKLTLFSTGSKYCSNNFLRFSYFLQIKTGCARATF